MKALAFSLSLALSGVSLAGTARADDCMGHSVQVLQAPLAKRGVELRLNDKRQWEARITARGAPPAPWQPLPRLRTHAHVAVIASDATTRFVVVDLSGDTDFGDRVLLFDAREGRANLIAAFGLESLMTPIELAMVSRSISHVHWLAHVAGKLSLRLAPSQTALELDLISGRTATLAFGPDAIKSPE